MQKKKLYSQLNKNNNKDNEKVAKKIKLDLSKKENKHSENIMITPESETEEVLDIKITENDKTNIYNSKIYDCINKENEQVFDFFECYYENNEFKFNEILDKPLKDVINSLYIKVFSYKNQNFVKLSKEEQLRILLRDDFPEETKSNIKSMYNEGFILYYENIKDEEPIDLFQMNCDERKMSLIFNYFSDKNKKFNDFISLSMLNKLSYCYDYSPYFKYQLKYLDSYFDRKDYENIFNYEFLITLNLCIYSRFYYYKGSFVTDDIYSYYLTECVENFNSMHLFEKDKGLFDRFVNLKNRFPVDD